MRYTGLMVENFLGAKNDGCSPGLTFSCHPFFMEINAVSVCLQGDTSMKDSERRGLLDRLIQCRHLQSIHNIQRYEEVGRKHNHPCVLVVKDATIHPLASKG